MDWFMSTSPEKSIVMMKEVPYAEPGIGRALIAIEVMNGPQPNGSSHTNALEAKAYLIEKNKILETELLDTKRKLQELYKQHEQTTSMLRKHQQTETQLREDMEDIKKTLKSQALMFTETKPVMVVEDYAETTK